MNENVKDDYVPGQNPRASDFNKIARTANRINNRPPAGAGIFTDDLVANQGPKYDPGVCMARILVDVLPDSYDATNSSDLSMSANAVLQLWDECTGQWQDAGKDLRVKSFYLPIPRNTILQVALDRASGWWAPALEPALARVKITGLKDDVTGYYPGKTVQWDNNTQTWQLIRDILVVDLNDIAYPEIDQGEDTVG